MPSPSSPADRPSPLQALRTQYQKGLLAWLKAPESGAGLDGMSAALHEAARQHSHPLWAQARQFLEAIRTGLLPAPVEYRRLAGRVDQELRRAALDEPVDAPDLASEIGTALAQLAPPPQPARIEALVPRGPLDPTLAAAAAILPLMATPKEPRFQPAQRQAWDLAVQRLQGAWDGRANQDWAPFRRAVFALIEGSLPLAEPALMRFAEALAAATDALESGGEAPPRLLAALAACLELLGEADFLEHEALEERLAQLGSRLAQADASPRSQTLDRLFVREAQEEIEHMRHALDQVPPDTEGLAASARHLQRLADPLELSAFALVVFRFGELAATLPAQVFDHAPGRDHALALLDTLETWLDALAEAEPPPLPAELARLLERLAQA